MELKLRSGSVLIPPCGLLIVLNGIEIKEIVKDTGVNLTFNRTKWN